MLVPELGDGDWASKFYGREAICAGLVQEGRRQVPCSGGVAQTSGRSRGLVLRAAECLATECCNSQHRLPVLYERWKPAPDRPARRRACPQGPSVQDEMGLA